MCIANKTYTYINTFILKTIYHHVKYEMPHPPNVGKSNNYHPKMVLHEIKNATK
jgi:hypothetical protein